MTVQKGEQFTKRVDFKAVDSEQQIATGGVFVPNKVDLQGDFARPPLIQQWAADFMRRLQDPEGEANGGVMHVAFPDDHVALFENTVLEAPREIGGKQFPAGSWIQSWQFDDDELWGLVEDGILEGYSIGAGEVSWSDPMEQDELPDDVAVAADYPDDEPAWELLDGTVYEVSSVDIPAVPDAQIVETKADLEKALPPDKEPFLEEMADRGHSEEEAERLWRYLQRVTGGTMAAADGPGWLARAKAFFSGDGPGGDADAGADDSSKASRTLSQANVERLKAVHDAAEEALASEIDFTTNRFTDSLDDDFDIADFGKTAPTPDEPTDKDASGGDTPTDTMTDDPFNDAPEWAKTLHEEQQENSDKINDLSEKVGDDDPDDPEKAWEDAPAWAKQLRDEQKEIDGRVEDLAESAGKSQQLSGGNGDDDSPSKADILGIPGGEN